MKRFRFTRDDYAAYIMIFPFFLFFILFVLMPVGVNFINSFTDFKLSGPRNYIGLANYIKLFKDEDFIKALGNTLIYALFSVLPLAVLGLMGAIAVNRRVTFFKIANILYIFPYVTSMVAVSMVWLLMYEPSSGIFNKIITTAGFQPLKWLFDEKLALPSLIAMNIWKNVGYVIIIYLAGLQSIPASLYESATVDGASDFRKAISITIPMLRNISFFVLVTMCIEAFKTFDQIRIMTGGGPVNSTTTVVHQIYIRAFSEYRMGYASAMSVVLLIIIFLVTMFNFRVFTATERKV
jgi:multiple sugar transport system permease protein/raffinose/stachyose/melibiose transport system permease protein